MAAVHSAQTKEQKFATRTSQAHSTAEASPSARHEARQDTHTTLPEGRALDPARATLRLDLRTPPSESARAATQPPPTRGALERELDRVQAAIQAHDATFGQQLIWLVLSQALFLNAYLVVLVFGSGPMVPGRRWLLAGLAIFSVSFALFTYIALRGNRDAGQALRTTRRELEAALVKFGRAPVFAPPNVISAHLASFAAGLLPHIVMLGWVVLSIYALAAPNQPAVLSDHPQTKMTAPQNSSARALQSVSDSKPTPQPNPPTQGAPKPQNPQRTGFKW